MNEIQVCTGTQVDFDLSHLPANRLERNRGFGLAMSAFSLPFLIITLGGSIWALQSGDWIFAGAGLFFSIIPGLLLVWGLFNLLTVIETTISGSEIIETQRNPFQETTWNEPLKKFTLQVKITLSVHKESHRHSHTYHVRLKHSDDLKSIELFSTKSAEELAERYQEYTQQLDVTTDPHVRDFNTDQPIGDPGEYGLQF